MLVEISKIFEYVDGHKRPLVEAEMLIKAGYVIKCGILRRNEEVYQIGALCLQSSNIHGKPHDIKMFIRKEGFCDVHCTCKGGINGKCKHSVAVLLLLSRFVKYITQ